MKRIIHFLFVLSLCVMVVSCSGDKQAVENKQVVSPASQTAPASAQQANKSGIFKTVTPQEAQKMIAENKNLLVVDVRSPQELREGFIAGSTLVPFWEIAKGKATLPSDQPLLLVCAVGGRSYAVAQFLNRKGYPEVYNLRGGISAWKKSGLPLQYK